MKRTNVNTNFIYSSWPASASLWILLSITACTYNKKEKSDTGRAEMQNIYDSEGHLKSRITIRDHKIDGDAVIYYPGGQISTTVTYKNNRKEGIEKKYYKQGQLYRTRWFEGGKAHGIEKRYYKTGDIKTIQEFKYNNPATGLKEYTQAGSLVTDYPEIEFKIVRERDYAEQVLLLFQMSDQSQNVTYYQGKLIQNKYFNNDAQPESSRKGTGELWLEPGFTGSIHIAAKVVRESRGLFITQATVRIRNGRIIEVIK